MPLYDFMCDSCGKIKEKFFHINDCPEAIECECGKKAKKIISVGHGGIFTDNDVIWLESASKVLIKPHEKPLTTRGEYKRYLKDNGLQAIG